MFIDYRIYNYKNIKNKRQTVLSTLADVCDGLCDLARKFESVIRKDICEEFLFGSLKKIIYNALDYIVCELDYCDYDVGPVAVHTYEELIGFDPFQNYTDVDEYKKNLFKEIIEGR